SSPVISDPATPTGSAISSSLSPVNLRPSLHLQLISALGAVYLYLPAIICSLPDCLVCFAKLSRDLYVNHKPDYPVFRPWTMGRRLSNVARSKILLSFATFSIFIWNKKHDNIRMSLFQAFREKFMEIHAITFPRIFFGSNTKLLNNINVSSKCKC